MIAMLVGTVFALGALAYVLYPLLRENADPGSSGDLSNERDISAEISAVEALREVEFDYATGKLSGSDYRALKTSFMRDAADELAGETESRRSCPVCGARREPEAAYCFNCGNALAQQ